MQSFRKDNLSSLGFSSPTGFKGLTSRKKSQQSIGNSKLLSASQAGSPKFISSINKIRQELSEILKELTNPGGSISKAKNACRALEICSNEEGVYQAEMKLISAAVTESVFTYKERIDQEVMNNIYEKHTEAIFHNKNIPYFYIAESALETLEENRKEIQSLKLQLTNKKNGSE